ncbi:DEAD/DEAH box helicase [Nocardioides cynanchi]|uniref:DEAD/DEAH box helicase n=1 Tax=Nocardioides cynanchi TaxID=2558918 RepID=UPI001EE229C4|nr:DEAD/DEAH box helicase [Nocardioides cynanchi]
MPGVVQGPTSRSALRLAARPGHEDSLRHQRVLPSREARTAPWPTWVSAEVVAAFGARGVGTPWRHQVTAAEAAQAGHHVVLSTGTASGKSLAYQLPALTHILERRGPRGERGATTLYISPTKALAQDQLAAVAGLGLGVRIATHDGDSSYEERDWTREHGEYVLTNPDMLHRSLLPRHDRWAGLFGCLDLVVVDECHHYRGVFGAHVAQVLRRLRRVCAAHGSEPTFVLASATVGNPAEHASRLTGLEVVAVSDDSSPRGELTVALWEPPFTSYAGENGAPVRRAASSETADLLTDLVADGVRTLAFVRSRRGAEQVASTAAGLLAEVDASLPERVASYRGGYLPEERREIEQALRDGRLLGLAATNALELGIDVSGLDAVLVAGFPGTRAAWWQQVGRAGRSAGDALAVLVARDDPLDTYLVNHPEALLDQAVESTVFDPDNPYVLRPHLCAAAQEVPLRTDGLALFGPTARALVDELTEEGRLRRRPQGWYWTHPEPASALADIRSGSGRPIALVEATTGRVVGTVDSSSAHSTAHTGAVYVHRGDSWLVETLDLDDHVATITRADVAYSTTARELTDISIETELEHRTWGAARICFGTVDVSHQVVSYLRRRQPSGEVIDETPLDLPVQTLRTQAVWWTLPEDVLAEAGLAGGDLPGSAHAAEHCSIGLLPLFATCDRWDIGGVSTALHADTGRLTVFVYDGHPGGSGIAARGYQTAAAWLAATRETITSCECPDGCPSCVQSPKCGNQNHPLDKDGAVRLLDVLLAGAPR